jgi:hypothetical protein
MVRSATNTARTFNGGLRPDLIAYPVLPSDQRTLTRWFNTAAFAAPAPITIGTSSKTPGPGIEGPGLANVDLAFMKFIPLRGDIMRLELRGELFNALDRANFFEPGNSFGSTAFGRVTQAADGRVAQVAMKFWF